MEHLGACLLLSAFLIPPFASGQPALRLVSARDHVEGSFTTAESVFADKNYIYLASAQGRLFILARDRLRNFPLLEAIQVSDAGLTSVRGDGDFVYVASADGALRRFVTKPPFLLADAVQLSEFGLRSLQLISRAESSDRLLTDSSSPVDRAKHGSTPQKPPERLTLFVSTGQAVLSANQERVFLSQLNEGDAGVEIAKDTLTAGTVYGGGFESGTTQVFLRSGERVGALPNPTDLLGRIAQVALYADDRVLAQTTPGCCGQGIFLYDPVSLELRHYIARGGTNAVRGAGQWLIAGNERGIVDVFNLARNPPALTASVNLPQLTGFTAPGAIEIRSVWADRWDNLIFAASTWGTEETRGSLLPSFFVLALNGPPARKSGR